MNGNKSEIVSRCFVNMVRLHHCWKRVMCASNNEFGANRLPVTRSRRRDARPTRLSTNAIAAVPMLRLLRCTAQLRRLHVSDYHTEFTLFDREGNDEVAGKRPLRTLRSSAE